MFKHGITGSNRAMKIRVKNELMASRQIENKEQ